MGQKSSTSKTGAYAWPRSLQVVAVVILLSAAACIPSADDSPAPVPAPIDTQGSSLSSQSTSFCEAHDRVLPRWASDYTNFAGATLVSDHAEVVAVLFTPPLRAKKTDETSNKILWVVQEPRGNAPLDIIGQQPSSGKTFQTSQTAEADPGNIYPTIVDAPQQGCWNVTLNWADHSDTIRLNYEA